MHIYKTIQTINDRKDLSQRKLAEIVGVSLGKMNSIIKKCTNEDLIQIKIENNKTQYEITENGFELLRESILDIKEDMVSISNFSNEEINTAIILADTNIINVSLLENNIITLKDNGITKIIIVLDFKNTEIISQLNKFNNLIFVNKDHIENSGSMESLSLAYDYINEDFILLENDILLNEFTLNSLINAVKRECILINDITNVEDKKFVQLKNGNLFKLGKDIHQFNKIDGEFGKAAKISYKLLGLMMKEYIENKNLLLNYEYVLLDIARDFRISSLKINN